MPIIAWLAGKAILVGGYVVVYGAILAGVALTGYAAVRIGTGVGDAMRGATESSRAARQAADASPAELERLQTQYINGQLAQHRGLAQAVQQAPQLISGLQELNRRAVGGAGTDLTDRDVLNDPVDGLTQPWTTPGTGSTTDPILVAFFQPVDGEAQVGSLVPLTLVIRGLREAALVTFAVREGEGAFGQATIQAALDGSSAQCDRVGQELVCGNTVTPSRAGALQVEATVNGVKASIQLIAKAKPPVVRTARAALSAGWDKTGPIREGAVAWTVPGKSSPLHLTVTITGATPNTTYAVGAHFFPADPATCPFSANFGAGTHIQGDCRVARDGITSAVDGWDFGTISTDGRGDGSSEIDLSPQSGTYRLQFTIREGVGCPTTNCGVVYRTGTQYSMNAAQLVIP